MSFQSWNSWKINCRFFQKWERVAETTSIRVQFVQNWKTSEENLFYKTWGDESGLSREKVLIDWPKDGREIGLLSFVIDSTSYEDINRLILKLEQILTHFLSALVNTSPGNLVLFRSVQFWSSYGGKGDENLDGVPPLARPPEARLPFRLVLGRPWLDFCLLFFIWELIVMPS